MPKLSRRTFLHSSLTTAASAAALGAGYQFPRAPAAVTTLPLPPVLSGWRDGVTTTYDLAARRGITEFFPGMPTETFGYNGNLLGPVAADDEDGIVFLTPLVPGSTATVEDQNGPEEAGRRECDRAEDERSWRIDRHACLRSSGPVLSYR